MRFVGRYFCFCLLCILAYTSSRAQNEPTDNSLIFSTESDIALPDSSNLFVIRHIYITGNKKTKPNIIIRELSFHENESYPLNKIVENFREVKRRLMNTGLFRSVIVSLNSLQGHDVYVNIEVYEKWYIFPVPFVKTVDQSFQQWLDGGADLKRVNYGINLNYNNFTGHNDRLSVNILNGYTKQLFFQYTGIYLDKKLKWSTNFGFSLGGNKEVNYMSLHNKQVLFKDNKDFVRSYYQGFAQVSYRRAINTRHTFSIGYSFENVADTIYKLNPYFSTRKHGIGYVDLSYKLSYFNVDFIPYPTKGYAAEVLLDKKGFNDPVNVWQLTAKGSGSWPTGERSFFNLRALGMLKLPFRQPYMTRQFLGYDDQFLQGYEDYVIDGVAGGYIKASLATNIFNFHTGIQTQRVPRLNSIPFRFYAKAFVNGGYVYNPYPGQNILPNRMLGSYGIGLDIVVFTDFVVKLEWSFNQLGENGLYLHRRNYF